MKTLLTISLLSTTLISTLPANANELAGYTTSQFSARHRALPVQTHIWFPANDDGKQIQLGKNIAFHGTAVRAGATPKAGSHPVILLSHGSGGNAVGIGWIAVHLAQQGMVVIAPNHQGTTSRNSHPAQTIKTWERPQDLSAILDQLPSILPKALNIDQTKIAAVGFSLGGYAVLASGGVQLNKEAYIDYCDRHKGELECGWLTKDGLDLNSIEKTRFEQSNKDQRIKTIVSIDPGLVEAFTKPSLANIDLPVKIINLGAIDSVPDGIKGKATAEAITNAEYSQVLNSSHFSFLGVCTKLGAQLIEEEGEPPICTETRGRDRADIHEEIKLEISSFLKEQFGMTN